MTNAIPKLTPYANALLARHDLTVSLAPTTTQRRGGSCVCGGWGTDKVGNEWTCARCWKAHKVALRTRGVQRCFR